MTTSQKLATRVGARALCLGLLCAVVAAACGGDHRAQQPDTVLIGAPYGASATSARARAEAEQPLRHGALWYHIRQEQGRLVIHARLLAPPARASFFLPGAWAGRDDYGALIRIQGARGPDGPRALTLMREQGRIDIDAREQAWVELSYEVQLTARASARDRFVPQALGGGYFAYAPTFLILPSEQVASAQRDIVVEVVAPTGWPVRSTWEVRHEAPSKQRAGMTSHGFLASDVNALRDAFLLASDGVTATAQVSFDARYQGPREALRAVIEQTLARYAARFGALGAPQVFVHAPGQRASGLWGAGRRGGFVLELPPERALDDEVRLLIAHEAFHLWNGHMLRPHPDAEAQTRWFKEGITHYIALGSLGVERVALSELAGAAYRQQQPSAGDGARAPYDRGLLIAAALDAALRARGATLHDWLDALLARAMQEPRWSYTRADLRAALRAVTRGDPAIDALWRAHVEGDAPIAMTPLAEQLGLHWLPAASGRPARLIPLDTATPRYRAMFNLSDEPTP